MNQCNAVCILEVTNADGREKDNTVHVSQQQERDRAQMCGMEAKLLGFVGRHRGDHGSNQGSRLN